MSSVNAAFSKINSGHERSLAASISHLGPTAPWAPIELLDSSIEVKIRSQAKLDEIIPHITAKALRLSLYRGLAASGSMKLDSVSVSMEWARAMLILSAMNLVQPLGVSRNMDVIAGYPNVLEYAMDVFDAKDAFGGIFRIYARTAETADDIVRNEKILASHRGHIVSHRGKLRHYEDVSGGFITRPGVPPIRAGVSGYEYFVDFTIMGAMSVLKIKGKEAYLIPGPPRVSREELEAGTKDVAEIVKLFDGNIPEFSIPIEVKGRGKLTGIGEDGMIPNGFTTSNSMAASGLVAHTTATPGFSMTVPFLKFR